MGGGEVLDRELSLRQARQELNNIRDEYFQDDEDDEEGMEDGEDLEAYEQRHKRPDLTRAARLANIDSSEEDLDEEADLVSFKEF